MSTKGILQALMLAILACLAATAEASSDGYIVPTREHNDSIAASLERLANAYINDVNSQYKAGAYLADSIGKYKIALRYAEHGLALAREQFGEYSQPFASGLVLVARVNTRLGNFDKALELFNKALDYYQKEADLENFDISTAYMNMGFIYSALGDNDKALDYSNKALTIEEKLVDLADPDIASCELYIGKIYRAKGDYIMAQKHLQRALDIRNESFGPEHPLTAEIFSDIGQTYA
ncbi:MAG: tetratricopeptide repeat protein, partial [Prevotella sp.]|nr:tetratricopeptide repeat protein [Prevotella sp.]